MAGLIKVLAPEIIRGLVNAFTKKNLKSKTSIASAAVAASTTAAIQANASPGDQICGLIASCQSEHVVFINAIFYLLSAVLFFYQRRESTT